MSLILPRVAGEDRGGGLNGWNDWNRDCYRSHENISTSTIPTNMPVTALLVL